jgi:hypothetical protein
MATIRRKLYAHSWPLCATGGNIAFSTSRCGVVATWERRSVIDVTDALSPRYSNFYSSPEGRRCGEAASAGERCGTDRQESAWEKGKSAMSADLPMTFRGAGATV